MEIKKWMDSFADAVRQAFGERVYCIGLQGSRARGEATADSDIDVVVILDEWRAEDWPRYEAVLNGLPERDKICGFVSGKRELLAWEPSELFGFYYDTKPWAMSLKDTSSPQPPYPSLPPIGESSLIPVRLLSPPNPLRWASAGNPKSSNQNFQWILTSC